MIKGKSVLAVIAARGGSKGVPRKNIRPICGRPLLAYTIEVSQRSRYLDRIVVSSEDREIQEVAQAWGAEVVVRPACLATDEIASIDPVLHAITECPGYDYVVLLQPTSPLRMAQDIDSALELCLGQCAPACIAVCEAPIPPQRLFTLDAQGRLIRFVSGAVPTQRQDLPPFYIVNGAVYVAESEWLMRERRFVSKDTIAYVMPNERSLDIDTEVDLLLFEFLLQHRVPKQND